MAKLTKKSYYNGITNLLKCDIKIPRSKEQIKEIIKCKNNIEYFLKKYVTIIHQDYGKVPFNLYDYQKEYIKLIDESNRFLGLQCRQSGKTVTTCGYILHYVLFKKDKNVAILANKGKTARGILTKIKNMYKSLPIWLQAGAEEWNMGNIVLGNGCSIEASATSEDSIRGDSIGLLYIDECAFIDTNKWGAFWTSTYPVVSSSKTAKIIMSSTPYGMNHWYKLISDAKNKKNGFDFFEVTWNQVPDRDEAWKEQIIKEVGQDEFDQEFGNEFMGSAGTLISGQCLKNMVFTDPIESTYDKKFKIYEYPKEDHQYVIFADFGEGDSGDYSTCQVIDVTEHPWKQIAVYRDNKILYREMPAILDKIGLYYNTALIIGESNNLGMSILDDLNYDYEYDNSFYGDIRETKIGPADYFGIKMTKRSKKIGNRYLKQYAENNSLVIQDFDTIEELSNYIKVRNSYEADEGKHDDLVTPLVIFSYFMQNKEWVDDWLELGRNFGKRKKTLEEVEENLLPVGFVCNGDGLVNMEDEDEDGYTPYF